MFVQDSPSITAGAITGAGIGQGRAMPLLMAADLQDHLMVASNDLERLQRLLSDACDSLLVHFSGASSALNSLSSAAASRDELNTALQHMAGAITAMQFQDMASQLVDHTTRRLRNCADRLANDTMGDDEDGAAVISEAPLRPNPVTQDEMDAGSVELF
jgi:molecular chaperone DnaK (HSP70)